MKIYKSNSFTLARNSLLQRTVRIVLVYSLLYLTTSEIFADNSFAFKNCKNEYLISVRQNSIELNLNERSQRIKTTDHNGFNFDKSAITVDQYHSQYTEYLVNNTFHSAIFLLLICNSNHSFRAPPIN